MFKIKILSRADTERLLNVPEVIATVEDVYRQKAQDRTAVWPLVAYEFEPGVSDMDIKSGWLKGSGIFGLKLVSFFGTNAEKQLPPLVGTVMVMDDKTGAPLGFLDGGYITGIRTGAAGAIGVKYLANPDAKQMLVIGAGTVAAFEIAATLTVRPEIERIYVYDGLSYAGAQKFAAAMPKRLTEEFALAADVASKVKIQAVDAQALADVTRDSQIIITVTPSKSPIIKREWVSPGTHFSCIGADMEGKEEIDPQIAGMARVFTDDTPQCINVGEIEIPVKKGLLRPEDIAGEIGQVLAGQVEGRQTREQITLFDATGTALLDLATAQLALDKAEKLGCGQTVEL